MPKSAKLKEFAEDKSCCDKMISQEMHILCILSILRNTGLETIARDGAIMKALSWQMECRCARIALFLGQARPQELHP